MQLKNDIEGQATLREAVSSHFTETGRSALNFLDTEDEDFFYTHFLINSRHVIRYSLGMDRRMWLGGVCLAIGPHYFPLRSLLDEKKADQLMIEASTVAIKNNLMLLDQFLASI